MGNTSTSFDMVPFNSSFLPSTSAFSLHHRRHSSLIHIQQVAALDTQEASILEARVKPLTAPPRRQSRRYSGIRGKFGGLLGKKAGTEGIELTETELL